MKKKFLKNLALLVFLNLLIKPFWVFAIDRSVQNSVGSSEYGLYFSLFSLSLIFNIILDLGITNFNNRNLSQDPSQIKEYLPNIVVVKTLLGIAYTIISVSIALALGYEARQMTLLLVLILNQFLSSFLLFLRSNISGLQFYTTDSFLSVIDRCIMIILCSLALWGNVAGQPLKIEWFVYIQSISYLLAILLVFIVLITKVKYLTFSWNWAKMLGIVKQIGPFALLGLLMSVYTRTDSVLLERLLPDGRTQAGIYAQSFRILDALSNFSLLFATLLLPMFSRLLATREDLIPLLKTSFALMFLMCITASLTCFAYSEPIIKALYHEGDSYSSTVFSILILSFIPASASYIFGTLLTANGNLRLLNITAGISVILNIAMNIVLIKNFMAVGAAVANLATQWLVAVVQIVICVRIWKLKINGKHIIRYAGFLLLTFLILLISMRVNGPWFIRFCGAIAAIGLTGLFIGILPVRQALKSYRVIG